MNRLARAASRLLPFLVAAIFGLWLFTPESASAEWKYTVLQLFRWVFPSLLLLGAFLNRKGLGPVCKSLFHWLFKKGGPRADFMVLCAGTIFLAIPLLAPDAGSLNWRLGYLLSFCWLLGAALLFIALFRLAARLNNYFAGLLCLAGSLALAFTCGEAWFLFTHQFMDGMWQDIPHSPYVLTGKAQAGIVTKKSEIGEFPVMPAHPSHAFAQRSLNFDRELFDVRYTLNEKGRRILPPASEKPEADLLLFGCSFTFGHGLEDEETWAWRLARDLGPGWRLENLAFNAFGPQQMLTILEEGMLEPLRGEKKFALYLAIWHQLRRNEGFLPVIDALTYKLSAKGLERAGLVHESPNRLFEGATRLFNGSQLAREFAAGLTEWLLAKNQPEHQKTYVAIIARSAELLRERYGAELTVLLWPDIEFIAPELEKKGVPCIFARKMLRDWDSRGATAYHIVPNLESHPNAKAGVELAEALGAYFRERARK